MVNPKELKYSKEHEWIKVDGEECTVGITDYAQNALGDIVFVELPQKGIEVEKDKSISVVESVKSVSDIYAPLTGEITDVNSKVEDSPEIINSSPQDDGWLFKMKIKNIKELEELLDCKAYEQHVAESGH